MNFIRKNFFSSYWNTGVTLAIVYLAVRIVPNMLNWSLFDAIWIAHDSSACREMRGEGACWAFITEKYRFILFGTFPFEQHWRPGAATLILVALWVISSLRSAWRWWLIALWISGLAAIGVLMWGGVLGLPYVENERWGGLILTLMLGTSGVALAFPFAILLALGRRSDFPVIRGFCVGYIELVRGVPLISVLFMASVMLPLFLPSGVNIDKLLRAQIALMLFAAAYLAEAVRGGLQTVPANQYSAASALGFGYWRRMRYIILPQALRIAVPSLVNTCIGLFKDTSLVAIIGLFDFLATVSAGLNEPAWSGFGIEAYLFAAFVYLILCGSMAFSSRRFEQGERQ